MDADLVALLGYETREQNKGAFSCSRYSPSQEIKEIIGFETGGRDHSFKQCFMQASAKSLDLWMTSCRDMERNPMALHLGFPRGTAP